MAKTNFKIPSIDEIEKSEGVQRQVHTKFKNWKTEKQQSTVAAPDTSSHQSYQMCLLQRDQQEKQTSIDIRPPKEKDKVSATNDVETVKKQPIQIGAIKPDIPCGANSITKSNSKGAVQLKNTTTKPKLKSCITVNPRQKGNPILKSVRHVAWEFGDIVPDYEVGVATCALYLSLRYHHLNPNYIHERMKQLGHSYNIRLLLVLVDVKDPHHSLKELAKICILADYTLILAFSNDEAGRYLETYKAYENKPPDQIMERVDGDYSTQVADCLTSVKSVNKTNAVTLISTFGSVAKTFEASEEELGLCPGFGPQKAQRLYKVLHEPFLREKSQEHGPTS